MRLLLPTLTAALLASSIAAQSSPQAAGSSPTRSQVYLPPSSILHTAVNPANGHTYHLLPQSTWLEAEQWARSLGGHLVTINDPVEQAWVRGEFQNFGSALRELWIGQNDARVEGSWGWVSGQTSAYSNWLPGEPNNSTFSDPDGEHFGVMLSPVFGSSADGRWNDIHDTSAYGTGTFGVVEVETASQFSGQLMSVSEGGAQLLPIAAGPELAGSPYWVLGSLSGTGPGIELAPHVELPLVFDAYTLWTLQHPNEQPLEASLGILNDGGEATAWLDVPAGAPAALAGLELAHAAVVFDMSSGAPEAAFVTPVSFAVLVP